MVVQFIEKILLEKSTAHQASLSKLEIESQQRPLSDRIVFLEQTPQLRGMNTIIQDAATESEDFIFYLNRLGCLLVEW
jgi:uridine kinase